jgi:hypothetical protein
MQIIIVSVFVCSISNAENIDPYEDGSQYAWSENTGWFNFEPSQGDGVHVYNDRGEGYVWFENIGWLNLSPATYGGVLNDGFGNLSGYAWGENVGWINFDPQVPGDSNEYGVKIDSEGKFSGWAWGENIGWINFNSADVFGYNPKVCVVNFYDLQTFCSQWLESGTGLEADLSSDEKVDVEDYSIFASYWQDYCPSGWQLK